MADVRPFAALRYDTSIARDAASLVAPPYDVVSPAEAQSYYARSPFNIARVENGEEFVGDREGSDRYSRAKQDIADWRALGALRKDDSPRFYAYDQEFTLNGQRMRRRAVFSALRIEEWDKGIVLPHEHTAAKAKEDRLRLLRSTRVHLSPIMALYRDESGRASIADADLEPAVFDAVLPEERHTLRPLTAEAATRFRDALADQRLYIADGHHRYETSLNYRNERRSGASSWTGEEPENFVLAALVDADDPGLVVLPIHRMLKLDSAREGRTRALDDLFHIEEARGKPDEALPKLLQALTIAGRGGNAYGVAGLDGDKLHLLGVADQAAVEAMVPSDKPAAWRELDVAVLHNSLLPLLGFEESPDTIAFTEDPAEAVEAVEDGEWDAAVLLNPTRVEQVLAVADAGERMPIKSTFFYPKLGTGLVTLALD